MSTRLHRVAVAVFWLVACLVVGSGRAGAADQATDALTRRAARFDESHGAGQLRPLLGIEALDDQTLDHGAALIAFLRRAASTAEEPLVAARARFALSHVLHRRGQAVPEQWPERMVVVGPFAAELQLITEKLVADTTFQSGLPAQVARIRPVTQLDEGVVPVGAMLRPQSRVAAFVVFAVEAPRPMTAVLRLGSAGAAVAWLDGRRLGAHTGDRPLALDADGYVAPLLAGLNRFVVRVSSSERLAELVLRVTDERGAPLALPAGDPLAAPVAASKVALGPAITPRSLLASMPDDRDAYLVNDAVDGPRPDEPCARVLESTDERAMQFALECAADDDAQRRLLERALAATHDPAYRIAVGTRLGQLLLRGRTPQVGEAQLREVVLLGPVDETWPARLSLVELKGDRGFVQSSLVELGALARQVPSVRARQLVAQVDQRAGRTAEAVDALRALHGELPGDVSLLRQVASLVSARRRPEDLRAALALMSAPHDVRDDEAFVVERAQLLEGLGRTGEAVAELEARMARVPDDPDLEERLGRLLLGEGHKSDALPHLRRALALKPQTPTLRAMLSDIDASDHGGSLRHQYAVDVNALRERTAHDPLGKNDPARALYDATTVHVHDNGLQETFTERVVEVHDTHGADQESTVFVRYAPDSQTVELELARVYKANGEIVEAATVEERDLSEPWAGLYYDVRAQVIHLTGVEPGDVVHVAYTVSDHGRRNELGDAFCDLHMLQESMARLETTYRLIAPLARSLHFNQPRIGVAVLHPVVTDKDGERRWTFTAHDVAKIVTEPGMAGEAELGAHVHASTFATWSEVATFYRGLSLGQLEPDAAVRRAARDAVRGKSRLEDKVAAIYDLVVRSTRYVGLEFGVHGYQPYKVSQVWARRYGDCKDKASLLVAMLKEVGVPATLVLLRTMHEGDVERLPASLALFDHAIAYVPGLDRYLDGTAELSGSTELPSEDQGTFALHVSDGVLHITPIMPADRARSDEKLVVTLHGDGSAKASLSLHVVGVAAEGWRRQYIPPAQRKEHLEQLWTERSPGAEVERILVPHIDDREQPVELSASLRLPRAARLEGSTLAVPLLLREPNLVSTLAPLSRRVNDVLVSHAFTEHEHVTLHAEGRLRGPESQKIESRFGSFALRVVGGEDGTIDVDATTVLMVRRIRPADYADFRAFLTSIDHAVGSELRVERRK
ncbi:MAG: DUF3857 domain-containing protein [Polyangia bacterium]